MIENLQLLIKPAGSDCNLACTYCFYRRVGEMHRGSAPRMSDEVLQATVRRYLKLRLPQSVFAWQGGEPTLMGLDFFRRAVALMQQFGRSGQSVANALQTNGLLIDRDWCDFFRDYRFLIGLSIDGPAELHDHYRVRAGGQPSHADVLRALHLMQQTGVEFNVLTVANNHTARHPKRIYNYLREQGLQYLQFIPCIETEPGAHAPTSFSVGPEAFADFLCELFDLWLPEAIDCISVRIFDGLLSRELTGAGDLCYFDGACGNAPVIESNGDVYLCDFFVQPEQKLGNIVATPFENLMARSRARRFRGVRRNLPEPCVACEWSSFCRGGCPKDRQRISGGFSVPTYFCETYKRLLAHTREPIRELAAQLRTRHPDRYPPVTS